MARGHDDALTLVQDVLDAVDRDPTHAVEAGDHRVAAGFVGADLLTLVKREERDAHVLVLRQRAADDLTGLIGDLIAQGQNLCLADIFHTVHDNFLLLKRAAFTAARDMTFLSCPFCGKGNDYFALCASTQYHSLFSMSNAPNCTGKALT